jgi:hypothetical protein
MEMSAVVKPSDDAISRVVLAVGVYLDYGVIVVAVGMNPAHGTADPLNGAKDCRVGGAAAAAVSSLSRPRPGRRILRSG